MNSVKVYSIDELDELVTTTQNFAPGNLLKHLLKHNLLDCLKHLLVHYPSIASSTNMLSVTFVYIELNEKWNDIVNVYIAFMCMNSNNREALMKSELYIMKCFTNLYGAMCWNNNFRGLALLDNWAVKIQHLWLTKAACDNEGVFQDAFITYSSCNNDKMLTHILCHCEKNREKYWQLCSKYYEKMPTVEDDIRNIMKILQETSTTTVVLKEASSNPICVPLSTMKYTIDVPLPGLEVPLLETNS